MSGYNVYSGVKITVEKTEESFHTFQDWGLYVANSNNCIGSPVQYTSYVEVPGRNGKLDMSEAISGRPIFQSRPISIRLVGFNEINEWDSVISSFRNKVEGKICKIQFDNDPAYYWKGRVHIEAFNSRFDYGSFILNIPMADPYKYDVNTSAEPWLWDPFNFETGVITQQGATVIDGSGSVTINHGHMITCPQIVVSNMQSGTFTVTHNGIEYGLTTGTNIIPSILVGGDDDVTLNFTGSATVQVVYRGGSL